jgi:magnesium transporter
VSKSSYLSKNSKKLRDPAAIASEIESYRVADVVEALNSLRPKLAASVLEHSSVDKIANVLEQPGFDSPQELIEQLPPDVAARIFDVMSPDRRVEIFSRLPEFEQVDLSSRLEPTVWSSVQRMLTYPPKSAGRIMTTEFVAIPASYTVEQALQHIREVGGEKETVYALYIVDPTSHRLLHAISLSQLILADHNRLVTDLGSSRRPITVLPLADREEVARLISKYDLLAVPVVDEGEHILGIVTVDDVIDAIVQEGTEDVQKFGGVEAFDQPYMQISFASMIKKRAGWLCALFLSEMLTTSAMQNYQSELERVLVLTLFIPLIMSSGGNSGSQATSLIIRALALHEVRLRDWWRIASREIPTGLTLGLILGIIGIIRITVWQETGLYDYGSYWPLIAATVCGALIGIVTFGSLAGSMLPFVLKRFGFDPASASAPFIATLVDVTGLTIYFNVAAIILKGTLL